MADRNPPPTDVLESIERTAVELAQVAGAEIVTALGGMMAVKYKSGSAEDEQWKDPVSEVDNHVETLIRARLAERFPDHEIIGEEMDERGGRGSDFVWAVDPIDGTANFVNGFPMFAATIGVLHAGKPVAGAVWCATSHALRSGVYHAREGSALQFDGQPVAIASNPAVRRRLAGVPNAQGLVGAWDARKTGSAAIECALVASGALSVARFANVNLWDIAGGVALVLASGGAVQCFEDGVWAPLERFNTTEAAPDLRNWRRPLIVGRTDAVADMVKLAA
ncbi:MAG: inositol monophosphatase [Alphaproteobacteria bacterium]|nr:inositol monophosphatase [Alphaproteobacteria bacterium]